MRYWNFHFNRRRSFSTVRVVKHWTRLPRQVMESPSLEILKTRLDTVLDNLL